jgi:hypothetical protein
MCCNLGAEFRHKPYLAKNTCFKWISQAVLLDGLLRSDTAVLVPKIHSVIQVPVGPNNFPKIIFRIILTWQPVFMISQVWARLEYHLLICTLGEFVIFFDITGFERNQNLPIISIHHHQADIWFSDGILEHITTCLTPLKYPHLVV